MTTIDEGLVLIWIAHLYAHSLVPSIRDSRKSRIERCAKGRYQFRKRIREVFVFTATESMALHHNANPKELVSSIARGKRCAFFWREHRTHDSVTTFVKTLGDILPIEC